VLKRLPFDLGYYLPGVFFAGKPSRRYDDVSLSATVYVIQQGSECGIIDAGVGMHRFRMLVRFLAAQRVTPSWIVLTHDHYDHTGNASALQDRYGCPVLMHAADKPLAEQPLRAFDDDWMLGVRGATLRDAYTQMNRSEEEYLSEQRSVARDRYHPVAVDGTLEDGDVIEVGDMQLEVVHSPGHSPGSLSMYLPACGAIFAGDLPMWLGPARPHPLGHYADWLQSLNRLVALEVRVLGWGHAVPTVGHRRCRRFLENTRDRVRRMEAEIVGALNRGKCTIEEVADSLTIDADDPFVRRLLEDSVHTILHTMREEGTVKISRRGEDICWRAS